MYDKELTNRYKMSFSSASAMMPIITRAANMAIAMAHAGTTRGQSTRERDTVILRSMHSIQYRG